MSIETMRSRPSTAFSSRPLFGVESSGLPATVNSARTWPSPGVSISSASTDAGSSPKSSGQPAHAAAPAAEARRAPGAAPGRVLLARRGAREHRAALAVEVAGEHVEHVHEPARVRAELLRAGADARVHGAALGGRQLARHAADLAGLDPARAGHGLRREVAHQRPHLVEPVQVLAERARAPRAPPRRSCTPSRRAAARRCPAG